MTTLATMTALYCGTACRPAATPVVFVVDDDASVRKAVALLVESAGWEVETFASAREFLAHPPASVPSCLILDVSLPDIGGLELHERVAGDRSEMPVIFITGPCDVSMSVRAMKAGALEFLVKPFCGKTLLAGIRDALERSRRALEQQAKLRELRESYASLTRREREVMVLVTSGLLNKQVGGELGISEITVKAHRGQVMRKMKADSLPALVHMVDWLGVANAASSPIAAQR